VRASDSEPDGARVAISLAAIDQGTALDPAREAVPSA
jgi:hypothetical protein